jgi:hypothetical protein
MKSAFLRMRRLPAFLGFWSLCQPAVKQITVGAIHRPDARTPRGGGHDGPPLSQLAPRLGGRPRAPATDRPRRCTHANDTTVAFTTRSRVRTGGWAGFSGALPATGNAAHVDRSDLMHPASHSRTQQTPWSVTNDLHVSTATSFHRSFPRLPRNGV